MRLALGNNLGRSPWPTSVSSILSDAVTSVKTHLSELESILKEASMRGKGLENCARRAIQLIERFNLLTGTTPDNTIHWFETHLQSFTLQFTPMIVADAFQEHIKAKKCAWIFTSATLTVQNHFQLFVEALGLHQALQLQLKSPFDYQKQAILYVPRGLPDTRAMNYLDSMMEAIIPVLEATQGKAFVLFTSYKALDHAAEVLKNRISFPLLLQGTLPKRQLIETFRTTENSVLLGTSSFWYGVDVRGEALSCVIIDKLPFAAPEDPILKARIQLLRKQGKDPFHTYQLPNAVLMLKQGAGRLIRDSQDRGILMICDPRLVGARYGHVFLNSLPSMTRTRDLNKVIEFYENVSH
jgi:ATP-dependent DNA helicase DinG